MAHSQHNPFEKQPIYIHNRNLLNTRMMPNGSQGKKVVLPQSKEHKISQHEANGQARDALVFQ